MKRCGAGLSPARLGRRSLSQLCQGMVSAFCMACPENADTAMQDLREIGPTYYFAPPRMLEKLLTQVMIRMEDAGASSASCSTTSWRGASLRRAHPRRSTGAVDRPPALSAGQYAGLRPAQEHARLEQGARRLYRRRSDRAGMFNFYRSLGLNLKQLYGQTEASVFVTSIRTARCIPIPSARRVRSRDSHRRGWRGAVQVARRVHRIISRTRQRPPRPRRRTAGCIPAMPASSTRRGHLRIIDRAKDVGKLNDGTLFAPKYIENKLKFFPHINEAVAFGDGRDFVAVVRQHRHDRGRRLGRAAQHRLCRAIRSSRRTRGL